MRPVGLLALCCLSALGGCVRDLTGARCNPDRSCGDGLECRVAIDGELRCLEPLGYDAGSGTPDAGSSAPDASAPPLDASVPGLDGAIADGGAPEDAAVGADAAGTGLDASTLGLDATPSAPDAASPGADAASPGADAASPGPDAATPGPDAGAQAKCSPTTCPVGEICQISAGATRCASVSIGAGANHTCTVKADGTLWCWGRNDSNQLGLANTAPEHVPTPTQITLAASIVAWKKVVSGEDFSCALAADKRIACWGTHSSGKTGQPAGNDTTTPTFVGSDSFFTDVAIGSSSGYGLRDDGTIYAWGDNGDGELGLGTTSTPQYGLIQVSQLGAPWTEIAGGNDFACGIRDEGAGTVIKCWGADGANRLGGDPGTETPSLTPVPVTVPSSRLAGWSRLTLGERHACALHRATSSLLCWGNGEDGQLATGDQEPAYTNAPTLVAGTWVAVAAGFDRVCAIDAARDLWCWGDTMRGGAGDGTLRQAWAPVKVSGSGKWTAVSPGAEHTCGIQTDGSIWCWGSSDHGQLGNGVVARSPTPVQVGGQEWLSVSAGYTHTCAVTTGRELRCWGGDGHGQLGVGATGPLQATPVDVLAGVETVVAGLRHTCALRQTTGRVWCWGEGYEGQLGIGRPASSNTPADVGVNAAAIGLGSDVTTIVKAGTPDPQTLVHWGDDRWGAPVPTAEVPRKTWKKLSCALDGDVHDLCLAVGSDDSLWSFDADETLATAGALVQSTQLPVTWLLPAQGGTHACSITIGGKLYCGGRNYAGQLGDGLTTSRPTTLAETSLGGTWIDVSAGMDHTCGITSTRELYCWGQNYWGQVGPVGEDTRLSPYHVLSGKTFDQVSAGTMHTCAVASDKSLWCWGANHAGQLGSSTTSTGAPTPVHVAPSSPPP